MGGVDPGPDLFWHHRGMQKVHSFLRTVRPFDFAETNFFERLGDLPGLKAPAELEELVPLGLFKGSYGVHGNELIRVRVSFQKAFFLCPLALDKRIN